VTERFIGVTVDAFGVLDEVLADYQSFVEGFLNTQDEQVRAKADAEVEGGLLWNAVRSRVPLRRITKSQNTTIRCTSCWILYARSRLCSGPNPPSSTTSTRGCV
jgi:hypothetical protein